MEGLHTNDPGWDNKLHLPTVDGNKNNEPPNTPSPSPKATDNNYRKERSQRRKLKRQERRKLEKLKNSKQCDDKEEVEPYGHCYTAAQQDWLVSYMGGELCPMDSKLRMKWVVVAKDFNEVFKVDLEARELYKKWMSIVSVKGEYTTSAPPGSQTYIEVQEIVEDIEEPGKGKLGNLKQFIEDEMEEGEVDEGVEKGEAIKGLEDQRELFLTPNTPIQDKKNPTITSPGSFIGFKQNPTNVNMNSPGLDEHLSPGQVDRSPPLYKHRQCDINHRKEVPGTDPTSQALQTEGINTENK